MHLLKPNIQEMAFQRQPMPCTLVDLMDLLRNSKSKCKNAISFTRVFTVLLKRFIYILTSKLQTAKGEALPAATLKAKQFAVLNSVM